MGKREKKSEAMIVEELESESVKKVKKIKKSKRLKIEEDNDDDDDEANEDLSLKIIEKALLRKCKNVTDLKGKKDKKKKKKNIETQNDPVSSGIDEGFESFHKKKKKKEKNVETQEDDPADGMKEESMDTKAMNVVDDAAVMNIVDNAAAMNIVDDAAEKDSVEMSNNVVLRRLLRGPRYFDPPDSSWGACYNCGEEGHSAVNCSSAKRKKPCFVCGSFDHNYKQCAKGKDCFICKKGGHRAKDCPEKSRGSESSRVCLKCGDSGHDMFSCWNNYSADDLKEIQCYICKCFGHLCCASYPDGGPTEISCYRCGHIGHTGLACTESFRGETSGTGHLSSCYRCGEEGHFARECTNLYTVNKWNRELSTPKKKVYREKRGHYEFRSVPHNFGKARKNQAQNGEYASGYTTRRKGGWVTDYPEVFHQTNCSRSPSTPGSRRARISNYGAGGYASVSYSSRKSNRLDFDNSSFYGSANYHHHRYSASRFGNSSHDGRRNYEW